MEWPPTYLQVFLAIGLPLMGVVYALLGGIKLALVERLQLDEEKVGRLVGAYGTMFGPTIMLCGFLTDALGRKGVWMAGAPAVVAALVILATTRTYRGAFAGVLLLGAGWAAQINVANVLMRISVPQERLLAATNFYDCIFGVGALLTPALLALILRRMGFRNGLLLVAAAAAVPVLMGGFAEMNPGGGPAAPSGGGDPPPAAGVKALFSSPLFWIIGFAFLFYVPLETAVAGWATTLILGQTPPDVPEDRAKRTAALGLSAFWLGFAGSRLIVSVLGASGSLEAHLGHNKELVLLQSLAAVCLLLMLGVVFLKGRKAMFAVVALSGLACGPVFPTMMTLLLSSVPPETMGRAVGFFFFFASVGWTFIPALIGRAARKTGSVQKGFLVEAVSCAIFVALVFAYGVARGG